MLSQAAQQVPAVDRATWADDRRAGDDARESRATQQPADRRLEHPDAARRAEGLEGLDAVPRGVLHEVRALPHDARVGWPALA